MRRVLAAAVAALILGAVAPIVSAAVLTPSAPAEARLDEHLAARLADASAGDRLAVMVHGATRHLAVEAVHSAGLETVTVLESIGVPIAMGTPAQITSLLDEPGITFIEGNQKLSLHLDTAVKATRTDEARAEGSPVAKPDGSPYTGAGQTIAIVDGGVDGTHPMFQRADGTSKVVRNIKIACANLPVRFNDDPTTEQEGDVWPELCPPGATLDPLMVDVPNNDSDTMSGGGHGTHVASIAAGLPVTDAGRTIAGTAPGASLLAISVGFGPSIMSADMALDWIARNHADPCENGDLVACPPITVVNNSYGPDGGGEFSPESATTKITERLIAAGVTMVWANGNGELADTGPQPGGTGSDNRSNPDGQNPLPGVISVANYDDAGIGTREGTLNPSSSRGHAERADTWPDLSAPGTDITAACRPYLAICSSAESDPNFGTIGGTSMAAPHVAGIVTVLKEANPALTPGEIELILERTAHEFEFGGDYAEDPANPDSESSFDKGHGLLDVVEALAEATGVVAPAPAPSPVCASPVVTDPEGDATDVYVLTATPLPSEPQLDVLSAGLSWDATAAALTFSAQAADIAETNPEPSAGIVWDFAYSYGAVDYVLRASREADGTTYATLQESALPTNITLLRDLPATFDAAADTVTVVVPNVLLAAADAPTYVPGTLLSGLTITTRRQVGGPRNEVSTATGTPRSLVLQTDSSPAGCSYRIPGEAPPPEEEPPTEPEPEAGEAWYLHMSGPCGDEAADRWFMDRVDTPGDMDGCTSLGAAPGLSWPAEEALDIAVPAGSTVRGRLFVWTAEPKPTALDVVLADGAGEVASVATDEVITAGVLDLGLGYWNELVFEAVMTRNVPVGEVLTFSATSQTPGSVTFGYEDDHTSRIVIERAAPTEPTEPAPEPDSEPDGVVMDGATFGAVSAAPTDNDGYLCTGPNDPHCVTFLVEVRTDSPSALLDVRMNGFSEYLESGADFDVLVYDLDGNVVPLATELPGTLPAEGTYAAVEAGLYSIVVQPYIARAGEPFGVGATLYSVIPPEAA
jgi:serine protease AprX